MSQNKSTLFDDFFSEEDAGIVPKVEPIDNKTNTLESTAKKNKNQESNTKTDSTDKINNALLISKDEAIDKNSESQLPSNKIIQKNNQVKNTEVQLELPKNNTKPISKRSKSNIVFEVMEQPEKLVTSPPLTTNDYSQEDTNDNTYLSNQESTKTDIQNQKVSTENTTPNTKPSEPQNNKLPEWQLKDKYYTIGEVAKLFGVNISHIRFWTNEFKIKIRTNKKGDRLYRKEQIEILRTIHYLVKVKKHTIKGAKEKLAFQKPIVNAQLSLKEELTFLKNKLIELKNSL